MEFCVYRKIKKRHKTAGAIWMSNFMGLFFFFGFYIFLVIDIFVIYNLTALSGVLEVKKMAKKSAMSIGSLLLQIALGVMLAVAGIWALAGKGGDDAYKAVRSLINGDAGNIIAMVFAVIELLAGILLVVECFAGDKFGKFGNILGWIVIIVWVVAIVLMDFLNGNLDLGKLQWWYSLAGHCVILGALLSLND